MNELRKLVEIMINKAAISENANEALKFSQAACNTSNAMAILNNIERGNSGK